MASAEEFVKGLSILGNHQTHYRMETQPVRVMAVGGETIDVVRLEDEATIAHQDLCENLAESIIAPASGGGAFRSVAIPFTVGRACSVGGVELQLKTTPWGELADSGAVWVAIYSATNTNFTPAASRVLVGIIGSFHNHRISYGYWQLCYVPATTPFDLAPGTNYFLCLCADDPSGAAPDPWDGSTDTVSAQARYHADVGTFHYRATIDFPDLATAYSARANINLWWRLYEHLSVLADVPLATGVNITTAGGVGTMQRRAGIHGQHEILSPTTSRYATRGGGGAGGSGIGVLVATQILYGSAGGGIEQNANFVYLPATGRVGIGCSDPVSDMEITRDAAGTGVYYRAYSDGAATHASLLAFMRSRGARAAYTAVLSGDDLGSIYWQAAYGNDLARNVARIRVLATENHGVAAGGAAMYFYLTPTGSTALAVPLALSTNQAHFLAGSAAAPSLTRQSYADDGIYWPADGALGISLGGTEQWRFITTALYPIADNAEDLGTSTLGIKALFLSDANDTNPAANGEVRALATRRALSVMIGDTLRHLKGQRYVRTSQYDLTATVVETTTDTDTVDADDWAAGKVFHLKLSGTCFIAGALAVGAANSTLRVKLGGTTVATITIGYNQGVAPWNAGNSEWSIDAFFTIRTRAVGSTVPYGVRAIVENTIAGGAAPVTTPSIYSGTIALTTTAAQSFTVTVQHTTNHAHHTYVEQVVSWED